MAETLATIVSRVERMLHPAVASGFSTGEIQNYIQDGVYEIELDYQDFANYTITAGSPGSISPTPDGVDALLIAVKAASNMVNALNQEAVGDAILIRTGGITLDTSRALRARGIEANRYENWYKKLVTSLLKDGKTTSTASIGHRIDNYIETSSQAGREDSESLWKLISGTT